MTDSKLDKTVRHLVIPIRKTGENYRAILSDDSIDRDGEYMSPDLIKAWAANERSLPLLANHDNNMQSLIGAWTERAVLEKDGFTALSMKPNFFSEAANPLSKQIKTQIDEASKMGLEVGVSIGFIPLEGQQTARGYMHTQAEIVEASTVPVQSNRNSFVGIAKRFDLSDSLKKTSGIGKSNDKQGDGMTGENQKATPEEMMTQLQATITALAERVASLEAAKAQPPAPPAEPPKDEGKELAELRAKRAEWEANEKKLQAEIAETKKQLETATKNTNQPKGKVPSKMGVPKEKEHEQKTEQFNATRDYLARKGIELPE